MKNLLRLILLSLLITAFESQAQTIYSQNFGTGTNLPNLWGTNSSVNQVVNDDGSINSNGYTFPASPTPISASGDANIMMRDCNAGTPATLVTVTFNGISTLGKSNLILYFGRRETSTFDLTVKLDASIDEGSSFTTISNDVTESTPPPSSPWSATNYTLPASMSNVSKLIFRFSYTPQRTGACNGNARNFRIDDFYLGANGVLPVKLSSFKAESLVNSINLNWETSEEINVNRFEIERSLDAQEFYKIETITAKNQASLYSFSDKTATKGVNYFRLKTIDNDDVFEYSKIVSANFGVDSQVFSLIENPVSTDEIKFLSQNYPIENLKLTSISGQDIPFQLRQEASKFLLKPTNKLNTGIYLLSIFDLKASKTLRVLIE